MSSAVYDMAKKDEIKTRVIKLLNDNEIAFELTNCCGIEKICIDLSGDNNTCKKYCCNSGIIVQTSSKDVCRIYSHEILYIAIEDRKSVLYMIDRKVETNYRLDQWKELLTLEFLLNHIIVF